MSRDISVGLIELKSYDLEGDAIYVTLTPHGGGVCADAISREKFIFSTSGRTESATKCNNYLSHSKQGTPIYTNHWDFIKMLRLENNGNICDYRIETDGLKLSKLFQDIHDKTGIIKTF